MISKKFLQSNYTGNNNIILRRIFTNNLINLNFKGFSTNLNLNFSHLPNALPLDSIKTNKKISNNNNNTLNELLLKKLSKNI